MALTTIDQVKALPNMSAQNSAFLGALIPVADTIIKKYVKRSILEEATITRYHSGNEARDIVLQEYPVSSIENVWYDPNGFWGQGPSSFGSSTLLTSGSMYALVLDGEGISNRGLLRRIGGAGSGMFWPYPGGYSRGKLASYRLSVWPRGDGNIKVEYTAGYSTIPDDLSFAATMLVAWLARNSPSGSVLTSESLGGYSYSVASTAMGSAPELGSTRQILTTYRDSSWGLG